MIESTITREFYEAFQRVEFDRWDAIVAEDVLVNSPAGFGMRGLKGFKEFATQFTNLGYRIDLVDEHEALDDRGTGRGFFTFCLNWKHTKDFGGLSPTGREGTSVETLLLTTHLIWPSTNSSVAGRSRRASTPTRSSPASTAANRHWPRCSRPPGDLARQGGTTGEDRDHRRGPDRRRDRSPAWWRRS